MLDEQSDELAWSILQPLSQNQRGRLTAAIAEVERLLMASMVRIESCAPSDPRARACLRAYVREISQRFGFDPARSAAFDDEDLVPPAGLFLIATLSSEPVGCGALKPHAGAPAEIKRLWVSSTVRGLGVGRRILKERETHAASNACDFCSTGHEPGPG